VTLVRFRYYQIGDDFGEDFNNPAAILPEITEKEVDYLTASVIISTDESHLSNQDGPLV
jgi:hypothetical protein